jgi:molybdopterin-guanine dinucleotide biosynthesis protein A
MGRAKARLRIDGATLLDRLIAAVPANVPVVVVGPPQSTARPVSFTRESPAGGGPVAGIAAGLDLVRTPTTVVAAVDLPFAGPLLARLADDLVRTPDSTDAVVPVGDGRVQPLCAAYRTQALRAAVAQLDRPAGSSMRQLLARMAVQPVVHDPLLLADVDTPHDWHMAVRRGRRPIGSQDGDAAVEEAEVHMQDWVSAAAEVLGVDADVDVDVILDVAKAAAHNVQRPAAPVTTYLLGLAVAGGLDPNTAAELLSDLADGWPDRG